MLASAWDPQALPRGDTISWKELLPLIEASNVGSLIYSLSKDLQPPAPVEVNQILEQEYYRSVAANTRLFYQLKQIHQIFEQAEVPFLLLKGAAMAQSLYRDPVFRLIGDIDLVIPTNYVPDCRRLLLEQGYYPSLVDHQHGIPFDHRNEEAFEHPDSTFVLVELHWHILDIPYYIRHIPMDWFWRNSREILIEDLPFHVLNPEANLVYLPAHMGLHHQFRRIHSLVDLALLIVNNHGKINWQTVVQTTFEFDLLSVFRATLEALRQTWPELPLSEPFSLMKNLQPSDIDIRLYHLLTAESRSHILDFYTTLQSLPGLRKRVRYAWRNVFPQPDYMVSRYTIKTRWQLPFWYLYRLVSGLYRLTRILPGARRIER
jgi:hypothetical protein